MTRDAKFCISLIITLVVFIIGLSILGDGYGGFKG